MSDWMSLFHQAPSALTVTHIVLWVYSQHEVKIDHIYFHYMFLGFLRVIQQYMLFQREKLFVFFVMFFFWNDFLFPLMSSTLHRPMDNVDI